MPDPSTLSGFITYLLYLIPVGVSILIAFVQLRVQTFTQVNLMKTEQFLPVRGEMLSVVRKLHLLLFITKKGVGIRMSEYTKKGTNESRVFEDLLEAIGGITDLVQMNLPLISPINSELRSSLDRLVLIGDALYTKYYMDTLKDQGELIASLDEMIKLCLIIRESIINYRIQG